MSPEMQRFTSGTLRHAKRVVVLVVGATVALLGVAMLVLPGPGIVVLVLGLSILAAEFAWARRWLKRMKESAGQGVAFVRGKLGQARSGEAGP